MVLSEPTGRLFIQRGTDPGVVHEFDTERLVKLPDRPLPSGGTSIFLAAPKGRGEVYSVSTREVVTLLRVPCEGTPPPLGRICFEFQTKSIGSLDRLAPEGTVYPDQGFFDFEQTYATVSLDSFIVTPPGANSSLRPDTAYVSFRGSATPTTVVFRHLVAIEGVRDFTTAQIRDVPVKGDVLKPYSAMTASPLAASPNLYLLRPMGIDVMNTQTEAMPETATDFPTDFTGRKAMTAGVTNLGTPLIYVTNGERLLVYEPHSPEGAGSAVLVDDVMIPSPTVALHLSMDGRFLLLTRYPQGSPIQSLAILDADTRLLIRDSAVAACPQSGPCAFVVGADPMALTIDGGHAIASSPDTNELKFVYIQPSRLVINSSSVTSFAAAIPSSAFAKPQDQRKLLKSFEKVTKALKKAAAFQAMWTQNPVLQAELEREAARDGRGVAWRAGTPGQASEAQPSAAPEGVAGGNARSQESGDDDDDEDEDERQEHLEKALDKLHKAMQLFDGCVGGDPKKDLITDCDEAKTLMHAARQLERAITAELAPSAPEVVP